DPSSAFNELAGTIYASGTKDPTRILATTTLDRVAGTVDERTVTVGADRWLLITAARRPLTGSLARQLPWIVLTTGALASFIIVGIVSVLIRRRTYALGLVEQRTATLNQTMRELETARAAAEAANQSKSEFLSRMSHELRTPLNAVLGFAQLLELDALTDEQHESVTQVVKGGRHLLQLINEVLDIARIETGNLALSTEPVEPADVIGDVIDLIRPLAIERSITINTNLRAVNGYVLADRQRLRQILLNLMSNAVKYNRDGGTITVGCEALDGGQARITVTDTGPGIPADQRSKLFQPFERLGAEQTNVEGTGVGLALSLRLAEAMNGTLDLQSSPGTGSTFWIELPTIEGPIERHERLEHTEPTPAAGAADHQHTVLYIEDNVANVKLIEHVFAHRPDIHIVPTMQGRMGLELAQRDRPALVLLDLHLPDIDGDEVLRNLRRHPNTVDVPVIVLSADATEHQIQRLLELGATAYLTKPINVQEFLQVVDEYIAVAVADGASARAPS
ncbi:MAG: hypothetical protein QOH10_2065, partial [Actinomycetota bacterium]|nr:hypothetical protein [Actinomycetota bacterium]